jgi:copper homeostasis protein
MKLELSVDTLAGALAADSIGVDRIELCTAALDGGLTPSHGLIAAVVARCGVPVHVLVRPRGGDFAYTTGEIDAMIADARHATELGAAGIVSGALTADGVVDRATTAALVAVSGEFTFHRAFDVCAGPFVALAVLAELGVRRLLTSGGAATAAEGAGTIAELVRTASLTVMAGGGIRPHNVADIVRATGVRDVHAAPRRPLRGVPSPTDVDFTSGDPPAGYDRYELDEQVATQLRVVTSRQP